MQLHSQETADCLVHDFTLPTSTGEPDVNYTISCLELKEEYTVTTKLLFKSLTLAEHNVQSSETFSHIKYRPNVLSEDQLC